MTTYLPTLKQLQYLVALHEHGHFGRAADACFVSQSTLSAGLRELESLLAVTLVERTRRVVRFTPLGNQVVAKAHRLLREAEELSELVQSQGSPLVGELRMSVIPTIAPFLLPRILPRLRAERPQLRLFLREEPSAAAIESLHHGRADCVLLALPFATGEVESEILFNDPLLVAFPFDDPRDPPPLIAPASIDENRLQPPRIARQRHDDRHLAPHAGADGRQRPGPDDAARNGDQGRHPQRHPHRRPPAQQRPRLPPDRPGLAPQFAARRRIPLAGRGTARGVSLQGG